MDAGESLRRWALAAAIIGFEIARWQVLLVLHPVNSPLRTSYYATAHGWVDRGFDPYQSLGWTQPPVALWMVAAPRVVDYGTQVTQPPRRIIWRYEALFRRMMLAVDVATLVFFLLAARQLKRAPLALAAWCYVALTTPLGHVLYDRTELGVLLALSISAWCWAVGLRDRRGQLWLAVSAFLLGVTGASTDQALLMAPVLVLAVGARVQTGSREPVSRLTLLLAALAGFAAPYAVQMALSGPATLQALLAGEANGLEVESLPATAAYFARALGLPVSPERVQGLYYLRHAGESWLEVAGVVVQVAVALAIVRSAARSRGDGRMPAYGETFDDGLTPWCYAALAGMGLAWFGTELPPERLVWTLPLALWLGLARCEPRRLLWFLCLLGANVLLTTLVFPCTFYEHPPNPRAAVLIGQGLIPHFDTVPLGLLMLRNSLLVVLLAWCWRLAARR